VPSTDGGKFNLAAATASAPNVGDGGYAEDTTVPVGSSVSVSETQGTGTLLANYTSALSCNGVDASGTTSASFTMPDGDVNCTVTNTRKTHKVRLTKSLVPSNDGGKFNLAAATASAPDVGDGGFAEDTTVPVGSSVSVSETQGTGTLLANYTSALSCSGVDASGTTSASFTMPDGDVSCTVTNTRKTHKVRLTKLLSPTTDPGVFNLTAAGTTAFDQGHNGFAENASVPVGAGNIVVSEAAGTNTSLANYDSVLSCTGVVASGTTSASFTMPDNDVSCTLTNTRKKSDPTLTTTMKWTLNDSALLQNIRGNGEQSATVTFKLYSNATCSDEPAQGGQPAQPLYTKEVNVPAVDLNVTADRTAATDTVSVADGYTTTVPGTYKWQVVYSGDSYNNTKTSACSAESTTLTIDPVPQP
jgi:hypothetical protein